jgi:hypothetical protein
VDRRAKVELFEQIRREYEFGLGTINGVARKFGVHRRMVRQALSDANPPERKQSERPRPALSPVMSFIDGILEADRRAPRKQRHTARRIWNRIKTEIGAVADRDPGFRLVRRNRNATEYYWPIRSVKRYSAPSSSRLGNSYCPRNLLKNYHKQVTG